MKRILSRCMIGASLGVNLCLIITIVISLSVGDGKFYAVVPELTEACGSEIAAVTLQTLLGAVYGAVWSGLSLVWEREDWSLLRQTATHFLTASVATLPIAYGLRWMEHSLGGVLAYFALFAGIYLAVWIFVYWVNRRSIQRMNRKMREG